MTGSGEDGVTGGTDPGDVRRDDEPAFSEPWQARAFAVAVQLTERGEGDLPWEAFQERLVAEVEADGDAAATEAVEATEGVYYEQWLRALERLLVEEGFVSEGELAERANEFETGARDASEFVLGEHGHTHEHGRPHEQGHGHSHGHHDHDGGHQHDHGHDHSSHEHHDREH